MKRTRGKKYFLYLKNSRLIGIECRGESVRKVMDTTLDNPIATVPVSGEATLLINREELAHHIISLPTQGKLSVEKTLAHELESLTEQPQNTFVYDWRSIGTDEKEDVPQTNYLLSCHRRDELSCLVEDLAIEGLRVRKIVSTLDLLIERGRALHVQAGSGLMVFEEPLVHFLFFRNGSYGFERTFELREEGFEKDFLLEIQRSFFYTKQKFKIPIERVGIIMAPEWLHGDMAGELQNSLEVPIEFLAPNRSDCTIPDGDLLNVLVHDPGITSHLNNLLPRELVRQEETRRLAWALGITEGVLLCLALLWSYNAAEFQKNDAALYSARVDHLQSLKSSVEQQQSPIERQKQIGRETKQVKAFLQQKTALYAYLKSLPYFVPDHIHLDSITWGNTASERRTGTVVAAPHESADFENMLITLSGQVTTDSTDVRYAQFFNLLDNLNKAPFIDRIDYESEDLLAEGLFTIDLHVKKIECTHGAD